MGDYLIFIRFRLYNYLTL